jgi:hypothetical protein
MMVSWLAQFGSLTQQKRSAWTQLISPAAAAHIRPRPGQSSSTCVTQMSCSCLKRTMAGCAYLLYMVIPVIQAEREHELLI